VSGASNDQKLIASPLIHAWTGASEGSWSFDTPSS
jgi:hypothetical protein